MAHLLPCPGCARHVRASDTDCPFCGASLAALASAPAPRTPAGRLGRAATFAFGAAVATTITVGCGDGTTGGDDAGAQPDAQAEIDAQVGDDGGPAPLYGGPPDSGGVSDSGVDSGGPAPAYGAPPEDAGAQPDSGGGAALYGAPPAR